MAKILLVEDDNNLREIYEARLMAEGYDIVSARDGEEALTVAMKEKPDLIISDVMMPKISGFDMLDILRTTEETKNVKIIMMTALSQAEDKARAEKLGADRYLVKSQVTLEDVAKVAKEVLEGTPANSPVSATPMPTPPAQPVQPEAVPVAIVAAPEPQAAPAPMPQPVPVTTPAPEPVMQAPQPAPTVDPLAQISVPPAPEPQAAPAPMPQPVPVTTPNPMSVQTEPSEEEAIAQQIEGMMQNPALATSASAAGVAPTDDPVVASTVTFNEAPSSTPAPTPVQIVVEEPVVATPNSSTKRVIEPLTDTGPTQTPIQELADKEETASVTPLSDQNLTVQPAPPEPAAQQPPANNTVTTTVDPNSIAL